MVSECFVYELKVSNQFIFRGKYGQRNSLDKFIIFNFEDIDEFVKLQDDETNIVGSCHQVSDRKFIVTYHVKDDFVESSRNTNVVIALYTTTIARLKLYSELEKLGKRVIYSDTDSIVFSTKENEVEPTCGSYLGELSNELKDYGPGSFITSFVSTGPKSYSYKLMDSNGVEKEVTKSKGTTLDTITRQIVNFDSMKNLVDKFVCERKIDKIVVPSKVFMRNVITRDVTTVFRKKDFKVVFDKRVVKRDYTSVPYGYRGD